jgi:hypothetical protein
MRESLLGGFDSRLDLKVRLQEKPLLCESEANGSRLEDWMDIARRLENKNVARKS